jgi:hypothetical protein
VSDFRIEGITAQTECEKVAAELRAEADFNDADSGPTRVDTALLRRAADLLDPPSASNATASVIF